LKQQSRNGVLVLNMALKLWNGKSLAMTINVQSGAVLTAKSFDSDQILLVTPVIVWYGTLSTLDLIRSRLLQVLLCSKKVFVLRTLFLSLYRTLSPLNNL